MSGLANRERASLRRLEKLVPLPRRHLAGLSGAGLVGCGLPVRSAIPIRNDERLKLCEQVRRNSRFEPRRCAFVVALNHLRHGMQASNCPGVLMRNAKLNQLAYRAQQGAEFPKQSWNAV